MSLPLQQTDNKDLSLLQTKWKSQIDPLLSDPTNQGLILKNQTLAIGSNVVNHLLGRRILGWYLVRKRADANIHDTQDSNQTPDLTLVLVSDAVVVVDIGVF